MHNFTLLVMESWLAFILRMMDYVILTAVLLVANT
jgi:hypothetical protein